MSFSKPITSGLLLSLALSSAAFAAPGAAPAPGDCRQTGAHISALIDASAASPYVSGAKAAFQRGIMECMEGDEQAANDIYRQAAEILAGNQPVAPVAQEAPPVADCQKVGSNVSALIDASPDAPNLPGARAAFQRGIMECMEGDDIAANELYGQAKVLLTSN